MSMSTEYNARELLLRSGIGQFNATMIIPYLFTAPATTDPKSPQIMLMVGAIQRELEEQGYGVPQTGYLDLRTANALAEVVGEGWERLTWYRVLAGIQRAKRTGPANPGPRPTAVPVVSSPTKSMGEFLPDVPGGLFTYGVVGYLLWRHFKKK